MRWSTRKPFVSDLQHFDLSVKRTSDGQNELRVRMFSRLSGTYSTEQVVCDTVF